MRRRWKAETGGGSEEGSSAGSLSSSGSEGSGSVGRKEVGISASTGRKRESGKRSMTKEVDDIAVLESSSSGSTQRRDVFHFHPSTFHASPVMSITPLTSSPLPIDDHPQPSASHGSTGCFSWLSQAREPLLPTVTGYGTFLGEEEERRMLRELDEMDEEERIRG
ncbi:hypothetical protein BC829DRAFT_389735, partial [Chytridium lagenaria]